MAEIQDRKGKSVLIPDAEMLATTLHALPVDVTSDLGELRRSLAKEHGADLCCPVTVQRLLVQFSKDGDAPFWRVVDPDRPFARRLEGGGNRVRQMLAGENLADPPS